MKKFTDTLITLTNLTKFCVQTVNAKGYITIAEILEYLDLGTAANSDVEDFDAAGSAAAAQAAAIQRANHTGTQTLATISDAGTAAALNTGTTNGTIPLIGAGDKLPAAILPSIAITETIQVANAAARLALTLEQAAGKAVIDADTGKSWGLVSGGDPSVSVDWLQLGDRNITTADIVDTTSNGATNKGKVLTTHATTGYLTVTGLYASEGLISNLAIGGPPDFYYNSTAYNNQVIVKAQGGIRFEQGNYTASLVRPETLSGDHLWELQNAPGIIAFLNDIPDGSDYVHLTGNETIGGKKTFASGAVDETPVAVKAFAGQTADLQVWTDSANNIIARIDGSDGSMAVGGSTITKTGGGATLQINSSNNYATLKLVSNTADWGFFTASTGAFLFRNVTWAGFTDPFVIEAGAPTDTMTMTTSGKVGIGKATPETRLHVEGAATAYSTSGAGILTVGTPDKDGIYRSRIFFGIDNITNASVGQGYIQSRDLLTGGNTNLLLNPNGGGVAIGTSLADTALAVGQNGNAFLKLANTSGFGGAGGSTPYSGITFQVAVPNYSTYQKGGIVFKTTEGGAGYARGQIRFLLNPNSDNVNVQDSVDTSTVMTLDYSKNVGIGTTSPATKLHVLGNGDSTAGTSHGIVAVDAGITHELSIGALNTGSFAWWLQAQGNNLIDAYSILLNPRGGNVGIGTSAPSNKLQIGSGSIGFDANSGTWNGSVIAGPQTFSSTSRPKSAGTGTPAADDLIMRSDGDVRYNRTLLEFSRDLGGARLLAEKQISSITANGTTADIVVTSGIAGDSLVGKLIVLHTMNPTAFGGLYEVVTHTAGSDTLTINCSATGTFVSGLLATALPFAKVTKSGTTITSINGTLMGVWHDANASWNEGILVPPSPFEVCTNTTPQWYNLGIYTPPYYADPASPYWTGQQVSAVTLQALDRSLDNTTAYFCLYRKPYTYSSYSIVRKLTGVINGIITGPGLTLANTTDY